MVNMFLHSAYTLTIQSEIPLPELAAGEAPPDVYIRLGHVGSDWAVPDGRPPCIQASPEETLLYWANVGAFRVRGGREITVDPDPGVDEHTLRLFLEGACLGVVLQQRGYLMLHSSAVVVDGSAVVFLGWKGWGKSTTAAAMVARGHLMLADDVVAVDCAPAIPMVLPGFPQLKLWPEAVSALGENAEALNRLHPSYEKRARPTRESFYPAPAPLRAVYILDKGAELAIVPVASKDALIQLVSQSYAARSLGGPEAATRHFFQCTTLAEHVPIYRLERPADLQLVPAIAAYIEQHLAVDPLRASEG